MSTGDSIVPCGTPNCTACSLEIVLFTFTLCFLLSKYDLKINKADNK